MKRSKNLSVISLFSGGLGLDLGFEAAGFNIRAALECNRFAAETIRVNRPKLPLIQEKIELVKTPTILEAANLRKGEVTVVTGGPSCQAFSTAGQRRSVGDPRGVMFREFLRVVKEVRPRFFVMENVKGILSAAIKHRALKDRGPGNPPLEKDEELGSAFRLVLKELKATGYHIVFDVLNAADFGVPQSRERAIFLGSRDGEPLTMPRPTHSRDGGDGLLPWVTVEQALNGNHDSEPVFIELAEKTKRFLKMIPEGGNWKDLPRRLQAQALGGAYHSWGGRSGFYRRLAWQRPSPALTTKPDSKATMLCHPEHLRPLSVSEYKRLQEFPDSWVFCGAPVQQYVQAGNAVPVGLGRAIAEAVRGSMSRRKRPELLKRVICRNSALLDRMVKRPSTILNPSRMMNDASIQEINQWLGDIQRDREKLLSFIDIEVEQKAAKSVLVTQNGRKQKR